MIHTNTPAHQNIANTATTHNIDNLTHQNLIVVCFESMSDV
jgi:hypothetical protein